MKIVFWLFIIFIFVSCRDYKEEFEPLLNVHCILRNNLPYQKIVVDRTYGMDEKSIYDLENVRVILSGNGICDTLVEDSVYKGFGVFRTKDTISVISGQTYYLQVSANGFDTLRGITTVPDSFAIIYPDEGDTVQLFDTLVVKFQKSNQWILFRSYFQDSIPFIFFAGEVNDTLWKFPISHWTGETGKYKIIVSAVDTNYVNYYFERPDSFSVGGVENGVGLFGSIFTKEANFYIICNP